jgi:hypothetical protein
VSILAYGHTGAGKSHTIFGNKDKAPGFLPLTLESIFAYIYEVLLIIQNAYLESRKRISS